jgi:hypothetical protein
MPQSWMIAQNLFVMCKSYFWILFKNQIQNNQNGWFLCYFVVINASEGSLCFQNFVLHNSRCQVQCGSRKKLPRTSLQCCYIFWSFGIIDANTIKCWELSTAQASARGVSNVALNHYHSCTDSIKPSLQFLCYFVAINASDGSLCFQNLDYKVEIR